MRNGNKQLILLFIIILLNSYRIFSSCDKVDFVFSQFPINKISIQSDKEEYSTCIEQAKVAHLIFICSGQGGIAIIDEPSGVKIYEKTLNERVIGLGVTNDGQYVYVGQQSSLALFNYNRQTNELQFIKSVQLYVMKSRIQRVVFNYEETIAFALGESGYVTACDISNKGDILVISEPFSTGSPFIHQGQVSKNGKFLFIADDQKGITILKIQKRQIDSVKSNISGKGTYQGEITDQSNISTIQNEDKGKRYLKFFNQTINDSTDESFNNFIDDKKQNVDKVRILDQKSQQYQSKLSIKFIIVGQYSSMGWIYDFAINKDETKMFCLNIWRGVYFMDLKDMEQDMNGDQFPITGKYERLQWPYQSLSPNIYCGTLSKDEKYLFVGVRSQGIIIFDVSDNRKLQVLQQIYIEGHSNAIVLSENENLIYYSNSVDVRIFQKQMPNLNTEYPNLFNIHQSMEVPIGIGDNYKWRCYIQKNGLNDWYAYFALDSKISIAKIERNDYTQSHYKVTELSIIKYSGATSYLDSLAFTKNKNYMYLAVQEEQKRVIDVYDLTDPFKPFLKNSCLLEQNPLHGEQIFMSIDELYIVLAYETSVLLISNPNKDGSDMNILLRHYFEGEVLGSCVGSILTNDNNYIISTIRNYGIVLIDVTDKKSSKQLATLFTMGGETVRISKDGKFAFVSDGFKGFKILNLEQLPELNVIGSYEIPGWTNHIEITDDTNYLIASTMDYNMISLFDIHDKSNPLFLQKLLISQQHAQASCIEKDLSFGFILNEFPLRFIPLQSQVKLHTEIAKLNKKGEIIKNSYNENSDVKLGETILIHFTPIYFKEKGQITKVYHYSKSLAIMQDLQSNMILQSNGDIIIKVEKKNLDDEDKEDESTISQTHEKQRKYQLSSITLVVMISIELDQNSFIFNRNQSDQSQAIEQSKKVWTFLKDKGCLNSQNLVQNDCHKTIIIPDMIANSSDYRDYILNKLSNSYYYNPIIIKIRSSFSFNQEDKTQMIESISDYIEIVIDLVSSNQGIQQTSQNITSFDSTSEALLGQNIIFSKTSKFIEKQYQNVLHSVSQQQRSLKISGNLRDMNKLLSDTIVVSYSNSLDLVEIHINDFINYQINRTFTIGQAKFISQKSAIKRTGFVKSIQDQIISQNKNSVIEVSTPFQISLDRNTFTDSDGLPIKYTAYFQMDGEYVQFHDAIWIKFDQELMKLFGTPPDSSIFTTINMKIVGSNGIDESKIEEYFYLNIYSISLQFTVNVILRLIGPLAFIFSLYRYRVHFLNTLFRERSLHSNEIAYVGQTYRKRITLVGENMKIAEAFFNKYLSSVKSRKKQLIDIVQYSQQIGFSQKKNQVKINHKNSSGKKQIQKKSQFNKTQSENEVNIQRIIPQKKLLNNNVIDSLKIKKQSNVQKKQLNKNYQQQQQLLQKQQQSNKNLISNNILDSNFSSLHNSFNRIKSPSFGIDKLKKSIQSSQFFQNRNVNLNSNILRIQRGNNLQVVLKGDNDSLRISQQTSANNVALKQIQQQSIQSQDIDAIQLSKYLLENIPNLNQIDPEKNLEEQLNFQSLSSDLIQKILLYPDGMINLNILIKEILEYDLSVYLNFKKIKISGFYKDLKNPNSLFYMCLKTLAGQYLINRDKRSQMVYKYLQKYAIKNYDVTQSDWYKAYIKIDSEIKFDKYKEVIPFPQINIQDDIFDCAISRLSLDELDNFNSLLKYGVNVLLIKELLKLDSIGLNQQECSFMKKCVGESLHLQQQRILSVEAFKRSPNTQFSALKKWTNRDFQKLPISKNMSLPSWMSYDCKKGVITLEGIPTQQDQDELLIRIYDNSHYILYQFFLYVVSNDNEIQSISNSNFLLNENTELNQNGQNSVNHIEMQEFDDFRKPTQLEINNEGSQKELCVGNEQYYNDEQTQVFTNVNLEGEVKQIEDTQMRFSFNNLKKYSGNNRNQIQSQNNQYQNKLQITKYSDGKLDDLIFQDKGQFEPSILQEDSALSKSKEEIESCNPVNKQFFDFEMNQESKNQAPSSQNDIDESNRVDSSISINYLPTKQLAAFKIKDLNCLPKFDTNKK